MTAVFRPVVRAFTQKESRKAAAWVRTGGHAVIWDDRTQSRCKFVFRKPPKKEVGDFGAWAIYDLAEYTWHVNKRGVFAGLAWLRLPRDVNWIMLRRAERDAVHEGPLHEVTFQCLECGSCCKDNEVILEEKDEVRFRNAGRSDLLKRPLSKLRDDGKLELTLLPNNACRHLGAGNLCGIYEIRPDACSTFPRGSECCLFAREDGLGVHDGAPPPDEEADDEDEAAN